jgi:murein tripeptide amidase MpaA
MPNPPLDRYIRFDELTQLLQDYAAEHPDLVRLDSIGKSHEGRDIWCVTITDFSTGSDKDKPAFWCDGNIHASEVSATTAVTKIIDILVKEKPESLKSRAFYLVPRLGPDGAEWALADTPKIIRSSTRPYPWDEDDYEGLELEDIDGDGRILSMRIEDSNGPWKIDEEDPRIMLKRSPGETGGTYYRVFPEGQMHNWDGMQIRSHKRKQGLDMNRNFPNAWRLESEQYGAGPYPTSEPEIRSAVDFICSHPNICGAVTYHTFSGVLLRPPGRCPEDDLPPEDVWLYKEFGAKGTEMTGYPAISVWHDFKYHPKDSITGVFDDWCYEHRGVFAWTVEIWSPQRQAGITDYKYIDWFRDHPVEDERTMMKWNDEKLGGKGWVEWKEFDHPQLGKVEIGGWDTHYCFRNPPGEFLEAEITPLAEWAIWLADSIPCLEHRDLATEDLGDSVRIRWMVQNSGYLPTNVSELAKQKKITRGLVGEIVQEGWENPGAGSASPDWLVSGSLREQADQLTGWSHVPVSGFGWHADETTDCHVFEWVVKKGGTYELTAWHERAGRVVKTITA